MKKSLIVVGFATLISLSGCVTNQDNKNKQPEHEQMNNSDHSMMNHSTSGELPEGLKEAKKPIFPVRSTAILETDHMEGMKGAEAKIVGAYDTTVYSVSYAPTTGGEKVKDHKWVIHEELKDAGNRPFKPEDKVILEADHMEGMKGAKATIETAKQTTVYMIDYTPITGGERIKNHKWVTGDELSAK